MKSFADLDTQSLVWTPVGRRSYQLAAGDDLVATLDWMKISGSLARGEAADGVWTFKRAGFFRPYVTIRVEDGEVDLATLRKAARRDSLLEFADGRRFVWRPTRKRRRQMAFLGSTGETLLTMLPRARLTRHYAEVEIGPGKRGERELSLLALVGWYRMVLGFEDEALVTTVVLMGGS